MGNVLGTDIRLQDGEIIATPTGDADTVSELRCLAQDLVNRFGTPRGGLWAHPNYGTRYHQFIHAEDTPLNRRHFAQELETEAEKDPRVVPGTAIAKVVAFERDYFKVEFSCRPISSPHRLNMVIGFGMGGIEEVLNIEAE